MSQWTVDDKRNEVASYWEAFFVFAVFAFVLFMLYPKDLIKEQVLAEKSNYELTSKYLQNMLKLEPENVDLMSAMAEVSLQRGNLDLTGELIKILETNKEKRIRSKAYDIKYQMLHIQKNSENEQEKIDKIDHEMKMIIQKVIKEGLLVKEEDRLKWYGIAIQHDLKASAMQILKSVYTKVDDPIILEQCVYMSDELGLLDERIYCLERLGESTISDDPQKWLLALYQLYMGEQKLEKAFEVLRKLGKTDTKYLIDLAGLQAITGYHIDASQSYMELYALSSDQEQKSHYFFVALGLLQSHQLYDEAVKLAKTYEHAYINDEKFVKKVIQFYLAIDRLDDARALSVKILEKMEKE